MTSPILLTGGTGTLGRHVTPLLRQAGHDVRILSRHAGPPTEGVEYAVGDLTTGAGVDAAVAGVETVIHCAGSAKGDGEKARTLVHAAAKAGVRHVVYISVVGADRLPVTSALDRAMFGYFASKLAAEQVIEGSGIPWTTLRAAQFHELVLVTAQGLAKLPVMLSFAGFRFQPVDSRDVAARLVELALDKPAGLVPDIAGPRVYPMADLLRDYLRAAGKRRPILPVRAPGGAARAYRAGANLAVDGLRGERTWEAFLGEKFGNR
jgi:uncharacterized protein YbjT (DUF2867 family)